MRARAMLLGLAVTVGLSLTGAPANPQAVTPPPVASAVVIPPAEMKPGAVRRYRFETSRIQLRPDGAGAGGDVQVIDISVRSAGTGRVAMSSTPVSMVDVPEYASKTYVGRRLDFMADASGTPVAIPDWRALRTSLAAGFRRYGEDGRAEAEAISKSTEEEGISTVFIEPATIGPMQSWGTVTGREPLPTVSVGRGQNAARYTGWRQVERVDADMGVLAIKRVKELDPKSSLAISRQMSEVTVTDALISIEDGWVISLEETIATKEGEIRTLVTRKVSRMFAP